MLSSKYLQLTLFATCWLLSAVVQANLIGVNLDNFSHQRTTYLYEVQQGNDLSGLTYSTSLGGYELSNGDWVSFRNWYKTDWKNLQLTMLTEMTENLGIIWGLGTGEEGEKYRIDPSLKLGFVYQTPITQRLVFDMNASIIVGGKLSEQSCTADYGAIGGVQQVNCRLAASTLAPEETLSYLYNQYSGERVSAMLRLRYYF